MKAYPIELRERIVAAVDNQVGTRQQIAQLFGVSPWFIKKLLRQRGEQGHIAPLGHAGGQAPKLDEAARQVLRARVEQQPDATLAELQAHLQTEKALQVSAATVTRALQKLELRRKKNAD